MEANQIIKLGTYYMHQITFTINSKTVDYTVHSAFLADGKKYIQSYGKTNYQTRLTTSERSKIKKYIENDFLNSIN